MHIQYSSNEASSPGTATTAAANRRNRHLHSHQEYLDDFNKQDESIVAMSDTIMLKSASQVPMNSNNPIYMYEEQEGSIDLRSEYSFQITSKQQQPSSTAKAYSRNANLDQSHNHHHGNHNNHHNPKSARHQNHHNEHNVKKKKYAEKEIQNWNDIY